MLKSVVISTEIVEKYLTTNDYFLLANYLKDIFKLEKNEDGTILQFQYSSEALDILHNVLAKMTEESPERQNYQDLLKELLRSVRNYVINPDVQTQLANDDKFLERIRFILKLDSALMPDVTKIVLQLLINLLISNKAAATKINCLFGEQIFQILQSKKHVYETSALLYNICLYEDLIFNVEMYFCILDLYGEKPDIEFLHFLIEKFISYDHFWQHYKSFAVDKRLIVLEIIRHKQIKGDSLDLSKEGIVTLSKIFVNSGNIIFQTVSSKDTHLEPYEVSQLLQVISSLCGSEKFLKILQNDKDLLINSGMLLINIHRLGKESENYFSSIQSLAELREPNVQISQHPAFGFKADLVRIIGNLCWKNKTMQDLTREAELIPVILDCCNMDARNPFILQWVILTVRNLCENNLENQKIIAGLHQQGAVSSSTLEEMGLTLHNDQDNTLKIVSLDAIKNRKS